MLLFNQAPAKLASFLVLCLSTRLQAETGPSSPRLLGIVDLPPVAHALLEVQRRPGQAAGWTLLQAVQRQGELTVLAVHPESGAVELNLSPNEDSMTVTFTNQAYRSSLGSPGLAFENAALEQVLAIYAQLAQRTLLLWPELPKLYFTLRAGATNDAVAATILQKAIIEKGLAAIPDGKRFIIIVPQAQATNVVLRAPGFETENRGDLLPAGALNFPKTDIRQVVQIYAALVGRKIDPGVRLPPTRSSYVTLKTETPLSREESVYALDTLLEWAGLKMVPEGSESIKPVAVLEPSQKQ